MQIRSKFVVSVVSLLGVVACGDDDGGSGTGGVSSSKKIGELNESEARSLCKSMLTKMKKIVDAQNEFFCIGTGIALGQGDKADCEDAADECRAENDGAFELDCDGSDGEPAGENGDCADVTVGDFNACLDATAKALEGVNVSCSTDVEDLEGVEPEPIKACTDIEDKCSLAGMTLDP
jgi:hypothetical protein